MTLRQTKKNNTSAIEENYLGDGMDSIVKSIHERKDKESNELDSDSDDIDNE